MDPKITLDIINDFSESDSRRVEAVHDLAEWMGKGGAVPIGVNNVSDEAATYLREETGDLILSVRVGIEYGDYSGLDYHGYLVAGYLKN